MLCGLWNKDHASCITETTLIEIIHIHNFRSVADEFVSTFINFPCSTKLDIQSNKTVELRHQILNITSFSNACKYVEPIYTLSRAG